MFCWLQKKFRFDISYVRDKGSWLVFGYIITFLGIISTSYTFANYLSPEIYGQYKYITSLGLLLSSLSLTGVGIAINQAAAVPIKGFFTYASKLGLKYGLIVSLISIIGSSYYLFQDNRQLAAGLFLIAILQPLFNNSQLFQFYLNGRKRFDLSTKLHTLKTFLVTTSIITTTLFYPNPLVLVAVFLISNIVVGYLFEKRFVNDQVDDQHKKFQHLIKFSKHESIRNIFSRVSQHIDKVLIFQTLSAADLAGYAFASSLPDQLKNLPKIIHTLALPKFSTRTTLELKNSMLSKSLVMLFFLALIILIYIIISPYIFKLLFPLYLDSLLLSQVISVGMIAGVAKVPLAGLQTRKANKQLYKLTVSNALLQILLLSVTVNSFGVWGAVFSRLFCRITYTFSVFYLFYRM